MSHRTVAIAGALALACVLVLWGVRSLAQEHHHPPRDADIHHRFYSGWMRPDMPTVSCCNLIDCSPAEARWVNGGWIARKFNETVWYRVPPEKVELNRDPPDARAHLCAMGDKVFCFIAASGS